MNTVDLAIGILGSATNLLQDERMKRFILDNLDYHLLDYEYLRSMLSDIATSYNEFSSNGGDIGFKFDPRVKE